nr:hypothetical protein BgiMline_010567 [Biomphalaria glabrata]
MKVLGAIFVFLLSMCLAIGTKEKKSLDYSLLQCPPDEPCQVVHYHLPKRQLTLQAICTASCPLLDFVCLSTCARIPG